VEVVEADQRVHVEHPHRLGVLLGHLLDVHATHPGQHRHGLLGGAVEHDRRVVLLVDLARLLHVDLVDGEAADVHAEDRLGGGLGLGPVRGELDAARLPAPADLDLGLHHHRIAECLGRLHRLVHARRVASLGSRDAVLAKELLALVFEEIHAG
jgi:hypothetical protein